MNPNSPQPRKRRSLPASAENVRDLVVPNKKNRQGNERTRQLATAAAKVDSLESLLAFLKISNWHYLLVGDGSCTGKWQYEAGFACTVINRENPTAFYTRHGGFDRGTNIVAEMMAYVLPLMEISSLDKISVRRVHIVTDCEYLPKAALNLAWQQKANSELWTMIRAFKRKGLVLHWHWVPRDTIDLNKFCHDLANSARVQMQGLAEPLLAQHTFTTIEVNAIDEEPTTLAGGDAGESEGPVEGDQPEDQG
jgi:ribonuclease HI